MLIKKQSEVYLDTRRSVHVHFHPIPFTGSHLLDPPLEFFESLVPRLLSNNQAMVVT